MKIGRKVFLIIIIINLFFFNTSYAKIADTLSDFIEEHDDIKSKTDSEIGQFLSGLDDNQVAVIANNVSTILRDSELQGKETDYDAKIKYLDQEYQAAKDNFTDAYGDETRDSKKVYKYYGYMLGYKRLQYTSNKETSKNNSGKTDEEIQAEFDKKYKEFTNLTYEEKKEYKKVNDIYTELKALNDKINDENQKMQNLEKIDKVYDIVLDADSSIIDTMKEAFYKTYHNPLFEVADDTSSSHTTDEIITEGDGFLNKGQQSTIPTISENAMNNVSDSIYTILLAVGIVVAVVWGIVLGIKYMVSSIDDKAEIKKSLIPYLVGCFAMFASFGIWRLIILVVSQVNR